jgi:hypothetical protein
VLVTATPTAAPESVPLAPLAARSGLFANSRKTSAATVNRKHREALAAHLVQRRRGDIVAYQGASTRFPTREVAEEHYALKPEYRAFFDEILAYCRETVRDESGGARSQRIRWWSALALLRSISSSPRAAAETLRNRAASASGETPEGVDEEGRRNVMDLDEESAEGQDVVPGAGESDDDTSAERRKLKALAKKAEALEGKGDAKAEKLGKIVAKMVAEGSAPIVFCRFIPTVDYVAEMLRKVLPKDVTVESVTGLLPAEDREDRVNKLEGQAKRVLVCTDCLSEGIDLQHIFDAVIHYDLSWNPTRHEQREGRVDRYGQEREVVRALTYYGEDNPVDGLVLNVLLKKHRSIRDQLGVAVPVPMDTEVVEELLREGLLWSKTGGKQLSLNFPKPKYDALELAWDKAVDREKKSRAIFAQHAIQKAIDDDIARELAEVARAIGGEADVERFTLTALKSLKAAISGKHPYAVNVGESGADVQDAIGQTGTFCAAFRGYASSGTLLLTRTHPVVAGLAAYVLESALDPALEEKAPARRAMVIRTDAVQKRTTVVLCRLRFHLVGEDREGKPKRLLAEDLALAAFEGSPDKAVWLGPEKVEALLGAEPKANVPPDAAREQLRRMLDGFEAVEPAIGELGKARGKALLDAHKRVRKLAKGGDKTMSIDPHDSADVLGLFVYLPVGGAQ